jgi:hypothetical protein
MFMIDVICVVCTKAVGSAEQERGAGAGAGKRIFSKISRSGSVSGAFFI